MITSVSAYWWKRLVDDVEECAPETYSEAEWDMYVSRLFGKDLRATAEDLEVLKTLCKKLGV